MLQHYVFDGNLKIGPHKQIPVKVQLEVATLEDDEWADDQPAHNPDEYIDGVRMTGELSFDTSPITDGKHPVQRNVVAELTVRHEGESSRFNILLLERTGVVDVGQQPRPQAVKRYFWLFFAIGKPMSDGLELFPQGYRGRNMNRIYTCTDFRGYWPVGVASLIIAKDRTEAHRMLKQKLKEAGIPEEGDGKYTLEEVSIDKAGVFLLNKGDYL
jgi:hypothetical protein